MPQLRVWTPAEVEALTAQKQGNGEARKQVEAAFDALIADMEVGQFATVTLDQNENKATTRNRLRAAAQRRGLSVDFRRTRDETVVFTLKQPEE